MSPGASPIAMLIAACAAVGVLGGARPHRRGLGEVTAMLAIGQAVAHVTLTLSAGHQHDASTSSVMLAAHLVAIPIGALLIHAAERAALRAASDIQHTVRILAVGPAAPAGFRSPVIDRALARPRRLLLGSGSGLRGPPLPCRLPRRRCTGLAAQRFSPGRSGTAEPTSRPPRTRECVWFGSAVPDAAAARRIGVRDCAERAAARSHDQRCPATAVDGQRPDQPKAP